MLSVHQLAEFSPPFLCIFPFNFCEGQLSISCFALFVSSVSGFTFFFSDIQHDAVVSLFLFLCFFSCNLKRKGGGMLNTAFTFFFSLLYTCGGSLCLTSKQKSEERERRGYFSLSFLFLLRTFFPGGISSFILQSFSFCVCVCIVVEQQQKR